MKWQFKTQILRNEDNGNNGGTGGTPPAPPSPTPPQAGGDNGDQYDDFGYKIEPATPPPPAAPNTPAAPAQPAPAATPATPVVPVAGYGNEPPPAPPAPPAAVPPVDPNAPPAPAPLEVKTEGLEKTEADALVAFSTKHGLTKEQAQAIIDQRIEENKQLAADLDKSKKDSENAKLDQRRQWHSELKTDKTYGENNFAQTTHKVNKVLSEVMTRTGKLLTNNSTMLLPDVMRDLADLHDKLYGTEVFNGGGNPPGGQSGTDNSQYGFLDDFYK